MGARATEGVLRNARYAQSVTTTLQEHFGQIDIYVFDQLLRGNITPDMRLLDAGCGYGRNLVYLLREGFEVFGMDADADAIDHVRQLSVSLGTRLPAENFYYAGPIHQLPQTDGFFDVVLCNSVLHFAQSQRHFHAMLAELWRVLRPGGLLFCRLGSRIGMDFPRVPGQANHFYIADGSEWFLVDEAMLLQLTARLDAVLVDPLKTTVVQNYRCMTTWVLRKRYKKTEG